MFRHHILPPPSLQSTIFRSTLFCRHTEPHPRIMTTGSVCHNLPAQRGASTVGDEPLRDKRKDVCHIYNKSKSTADAVQVNVNLEEQLTDNFNFRKRKCSENAGYLKSSQCISDHSLVAYNINMRRENQAKHTYCYRNIKNVKLDTFKYNIVVLVVADGYTDVFDNEIRRLLAKLRRYELQ